MTREDELLVEEICNSLGEEGEQELDDLEFGWCSNCNNDGGNTRSKN